MRFGRELLPTGFTGVQLGESWPQELRLGSSPHRRLGRGVLLSGVQI